MLTLTCFVLSQVFDILTGKLLTSCSQGHYEPVNCCVTNPLTQELYSGASDAQVRDICVLHFVWRGM